MPLAIASTHNLPGFALLLLSMSTFGHKADIPITQRCPLSGVKRTSARPFCCNGVALDDCTRTSSVPVKNVGKPLLQIDGLIMPGLIELCTPHLVHPLVVGPAEGHRRPEAKVEIAKIFKGSY